MVIQGQWQSHVIESCNGMNQWTQENVKFKATINQWHPDTATQSLGIVASGIAAAVNFQQAMVVVRFF